MNNYTLVKISELRLNDVLAQDVYDDNNMLIATKNTLVTPKLLLELKDYYDFIKVVKDTECTNEFVDNSNEFACLSDDIKERTVKGLAYIYSNYDSDSVSDVAEAVSDELVSAMMTSSSIGFNLDTLKVSDDYTFKHSVDVASLGVVVGKEAGFTKQNLKDIAIAGILHDVGKIKIPNEILNKPGKLDAEEYELIKQHPIYGYDILRTDRDIPDGALLGVLEHHEKVDGSGYPYRKRGAEISNIGRLLCIVDVYDALVTKRPYRSEVITPVSALEIMFSMRNTFDDRLFNCFLDCLVIYPNGSNVVLSDGKVYTVVGQNKGYPLRPKVRALIEDISLDLMDDVSSMGLTIISTCPDIKLK